MNNLKLKILKERALTASKTFIIYIGTFFHSTEKNPL